jgi:hypothetical protein
MFRRTHVVMLAALVFAQPDAPASAAELKLPPEIDCYVAGVKSEDLERVLGCFAEGAVVIDVTRRFEGIEAIRGWAGRELIGGRVTIISVEPQNPNLYRCLVTWSAGGTSAFRAWYIFEVEGGRILSLQFEYA